MIETAPILLVMRTQGKKPPAPGSLGKRIRKLRKVKGLTQTELARRVGLSSRMMAYYEIQGGSPSSDLLKRLSGALDASTEVLAGREAPPKRMSEAPDFGLWRRVKRIGELPLHDQKTTPKMIDATANQAGKRKAS